MIGAVLLWGTVAGVIHFVVLGALYGNPLVDRLYREAGETSAALRRWPSKPGYMARMFLGTQVEIYLLALAFFWLRPLLPLPGLPGALALGALLAGVRVYPRFWNMWIQTTYPGRLLAVELVNGVVGTLVVVTALQLLGR